MIKALLSLMKPPVFDDPDQTYQARLLNAIILTIFVGMVLFAAAFLVVNAARLERLLFVMILVPPFAVARNLLNRGQVNRAAYLVVSAIWIMITLTVFSGGGIRAPGVPTYVVPVVLAGFLLGWRIGVVYTALTFLSFTAFTLAELAGWQPTLLVYSTSGMLIIQVIVHLVMLVLVGLADRGVRQALADSRLNERRFQETFDNAPIGMALVDLNERIFKVNQALAAILGYSSEQLITKTIPQITHPDDVQREVARKQIASRGGSPNFSMEKRYIHADGHVVWGRLSVSLVPDALGRPSYYIGQLEDITEQRRADERIRKLNRIYLLLSNINQEIVRTRDLKLLYPNACRIAVEDGGFLLAWVGLTVPSSGVVEVVARYGAAEEYPVTSFMLLEDDPAGREPSTEAILGGQRVICNDIAALECPSAWRGRMLGRGYRAMAAFPLVVHGEVRGVFNLFVAEPDHFDEEELRLLDELAMDLSFAMEVAEEESARRRAEDMLSHSEERYRRLSEDMPAMVCTFLPDSTLTYVNDAYCEYFQQRPEDLIGRRFLDFLPNEAERQSAVAQYMSLTPGNSRKTYEHPVVTPDGTERWQQWVDRAFFGPSGEIVSFQSVGLDITERRLAEDRRLEAETLRIELGKERELSELKTRFVSMVSHEFRTPLAVIFLASSTVLAYSDRLSDERKAEKLKLIQSQVKRLEAILEDTLFIARDELGKLRFAPTRIDLERFIQELVQDVEHLSQVERIAVSGDGNCGAVSVDTNLLRHILINLLSNALKYSPEDRAVQLDLACADGRVILRVQDQGIGIPEDDLRHLFEPFHRARNVGEISGTGLGLTIVKRSVEAHGGTIRVESRLGEGTTVTVALPVEA
jgi:PAS domain S-box-containing protein